jgi:hypothetical protein
LPENSNEDLPSSDTPLPEDILEETAPHEIQSKRSIWKKLLKTAMPIIFHWENLESWEKFQWVMATPGDFLISLSTPVIYKYHIDSSEINISVDLNQNDMDEIQDQHSSIIPIQSTAVSVIQMFTGILLSTLFLTG